MTKNLTIADAHSHNKPKQTLTIELYGGSPWFGYVWINDVCYTVIEGQRVVKINKTLIIKQKPSAAL